MNAILRGGMYSRNLEQYMAKTQPPTCRIPFASLAGNTLGIVAESQALFPWSMHEYGIRSLLLHTTSPGEKG